MLATASATSPRGQENPNPCSPTLPDVGTGVPVPQDPGGAARTLLQAANQRQHRPPGAAERAGGCVAKKKQLAACLPHPSTPSPASRGIRNVLSARMEPRPPREVVQSLVLSPKKSPPVLLLPAPQKSSRSPKVPKGRPVPAAQRCHCSAQRIWEENSQNRDQNPSSHHRHTQPGASLS